MVLGWLHCLHWDRFAPVKLLIDNWCTPVVCWAVDGRDVVLVSSGIIFGVGGRCGQ